MEMAEPGKAEVSEIVNRVSQYLANATSNESLINLPVAEAMVTYKEKRYIITSIKASLHLRSFIVRHFNLNRGESNLTP